MKQIALGLIEFYQHAISPYLPGACRYVPTCSHYAHGAIERFGIIRGGWIAIRRLARCRPSGGSGFDPIPPTKDETSHRGRLTSVPKWTAVSRTRLITRFAAVPLIALLAITSLAGCVGSRSTATESWSGLASEGNDVFVGTKQGKVFQLSSAAGVPATRPFVAPDPGQEGGYPAFYGTPAVSQGRLYVAGYHGTVYAMDAGNLGGIQTFEIDGEDLAKGVAGGVIISEGKAVFAAAETPDSGRLYVVDAKTMVETCRYPARGQTGVGQLWTTPLVDSGVAYFADLDHQLHAVRISDCSPVWAASPEFTGGVVATPVLLNGSLYIGSFDKVFYAVDASSGLIASEFTADGWFWGTPATDGQRLYVPNVDGHIYGYEPGIGVIWKYPDEPDADPIVSRPVVINGQIFYGDDDGTLTVLDARTGEFQWDRKIGSKIRAPLTNSGDLLFIQTVDDLVSAIDITTKRMVWSRELEDLD